MVAASDKACADTTSSNVKIFPFANSDFYVAPVCTNINLSLINKTIDAVPPVLNYLWNFGNGQTSTLRNPVYSYPSPGTYTISLAVSTSQCPLTYTIKQQDIVIDAPAPGITYPDKNAIMNFPERLNARQIGNTVLWSPAISLDNRYAYSPNFRGVNPQLYTIQLKTPSGCLTVDTQMVRTLKKIEIYVPTVFTPGSSAGLNDYLRPQLMGFDHVNYFRIFNRWGKMIFQMQSDRPGWDGKVNGVVQEMQTVVWMIEAVDIDGKVHSRQGTTVLMR
jgi:gliding motility-associated-like protein